MIMRNYAVWQIISWAALVSPVKFFEEENLTNEEFEKYPAVSRDERESEAWEGVMEVEEVRSVEGAEMSRMTLVDLTTLHDKLTFYCTPCRDTKNDIEIWHR